MKIRREVLGDAHVDAETAGADAFGNDFDELTTRHAWGEVWARDGLDRRTRAAVALAALATGGHLDDLAAHTRAALRAGLTPDEIKEVLLQTGLYCGFPRRTPRSASRARSSGRKRPRADDLIPRLSAAPGAGWGHEPEADQEDPCLRPAGEGRPHPRHRPGYVQ